MEKDLKLYKIVVHILGKPQSRFEQYGIDAFQRAIPPRLNLRHELHLRHVGDEAFRSLEAVDVHEHVRNLAGRHSLGIHRDDFLVDFRDVLQAFLDDPWLEFGVAVQSIIEDGKNNLFQHYDLHSKNIVM